MTTAPRSGRRRALRLLRDAAIAAGLTLLLIEFVVQSFRVEGASMEPLLLPGERILVNKLSVRLSGVERGDLVVFRSPLDPEVALVKRVAGVPGDTVPASVTAPDPTEFRSSGEATRDTGRGAGGRARPVEVTPGHYFVLGDNRSQSSDSRHWGLVPADHVVGRAFWRLWPPGRMGPLSGRSSAPSPEAGR